LNPKTGRYVQRNGKVGKALGGVQTRGARAAIPASRRNELAKLPNRKGIVKGDSVRKLTVEQQDYVLDCLGKGWPPPVVRAKMRELGMPDVTTVTIRSYKTTRAEEIEARRVRWLAKLRGEPLAEPRDRLRELRYLYAQMIMAELREPCPGCVGAGQTTITEKKGKTEVKRQQVCPACRGKKYLLPEAVIMLVKELRGDVRLETLIPLLEAIPGATPKFNERAAEILRQIREETGDAWSPRDQGKVPDAVVDGGQHVHFHGAETVEAVLRGLKAVQELTPEQVVSLSERELARKGAP
jgi:hypothetical protein